MSHTERPGSPPIGVLQLIDTLAVGGAERMAVNLANALPRTRYRSFLGTTRAEGPLATAIDPAVSRLRLDRRGRFDVAALRRLARFVRAHDIRLLHAHSSSLFVASAAHLFLAGRRPALIWHDHYGRHDTHPRRPWLYRRPVRGADGVIAVNPRLAAWSRDVLGVAHDRVWYLRNFVLPAPDTGPQPTLPGNDGGRIVCVANFRRQKDHQTLIEAMASLAEHHPSAHLLLVGTGNETRTATEETIARLGLQERITLLGRRDDVPAVLQACEIGVLSSTSEGLPLALLEYGHARLATVSTAVGECAEVLGDAGLLVPPSDPAALGAALSRLLDDGAERRRLGACLHRRVTSVYGVAAAVTQLEGYYRTALGDPESA